MRAQACPACALQIKGIAMKSLLPALPCFLMIIPLLSRAQNLVVNPSFEEHTSCPTGANATTYHNAITLVTGWGTPTISSDYYHVCGDQSLGVPDNLAGHAFPRTGDAYVGYHLWSGSWSIPGNAAEYLEGSLSSPLEQDSFYLVELFTSLADNYAIATDEFSLLLTDTFFRMPSAISGMFTSLIIPAAPQLNNRPGYFLASQEEWMPLRWVYKAQGGERYFTMGVFRPSAEISWIEADEVGTLGCYIFIDDVRIEKLPNHLGQLGLRDTILCTYPFELELSASGLHSGYRWSTGDSTLSITVTEPGQYMLEAYYGEFLIRDTAVVQYLPPEQVSLGADSSLCAQDTPFALTAPYGMDVYRWSTGDTTASISVSESGLYWLEAEYACGQVRDSIQLDVENPQPFSLGADTLFCGDSPIGLPLQAGPGYESYAWNNGQNTAGIVAAAPGLYWVEARHFCGDYRDSILLEQQPLLSLGLPADTLACLEEPLRLAAAPGFDSYRWSTGETGSVIEAVEYGTYTLEASYPCGMPSIAITVEAPAPLEVQLPAQVEVNLGESIALHPALSRTGGVQYHWSPADGLSCPRCARPVASPSASQAYTLEVRDEYGCSAQASVEVVVKPRLRAYVPSAFSPNGDGVNDRLAFFAGPEVREVRWFRVYNRWGGLVYERKDFEPNLPGAGWDGEVNGTPAPAGTYAWAAEVEQLGGQVARLDGEVLLVR